jgi:hypothetical protein
MTGWASDGLKKPNNTNAHPSPDSDPLLIHIMFPSPDPNVDVVSNALGGSPGINSALQNSLCRVYLISSLKKPEVVFHRVPQLPTLETRATPVNNDHDVLVVGRQDRVPISVKPDIDLLCTRPIVPWWWVCQRFHQHAVTERGEM